MPRIVLNVNDVCEIGNGIKTGIPRIEFALFKYLSRDYKGEVVFLVNRPTRHGFYRIDENKIAFAKNNKRLPFLYRFINSIKKRAGMRNLILKKHTGGKFERWREGDIYLTVSNIWEKMPKDEYDQLRKNSRIKVALFCHDLAPVVVPHFYTYGIRADFSWCHYVLASADLVVCNSKFTQNTLTAFLKQLNLNVSSVVVPLSAQLECKKADYNSAFDCFRFNKFILAVGTINERKNYGLLCDIWASYEHDEVMHDVALVIVGQKGWAADAILQRFTHDSKLSDRLFHLESVSDTELVWLYENCLFTVYPSFYEGWGLPITESLAFGKVCVASSSTSMPEASQGLGIHIDPLDYTSWRKEIRRLVQDQCYRESYELKIQECFTLEDWDAVAKKIVYHLLQTI